MNPFIAKRAYQLWLAAGKPEGRDLDFWLEAEKEVCLCVLAPGECDKQRIIPTTGGRHISICTCDKPSCPCRAINNSKYSSKGRYTKV